MSNHDELMCNFFAQADALAYGKVGFHSYLHFCFSLLKLSLVVLLVWVEN